jgi:hypothetical protein
MTLPDLVFSPGQGTIHGRVLDQYKEPISGLAVVCFRYPGNWNDTIMIVGTNGEGEFALEGLPARTVGVKIGPTGFVGYRDLLLTNGLDPFVLDLRDNPIIQLGSISVTRDLPFQIEGRIIIDEKVREFVPIGSLGLAATWDDGRSEQRIWVNPDTGAFRWQTIDMAQLTLRLFHAGSRHSAAPSSLRSESIRSIPILPAPDDSMDLEIRFP